MGGVWSDEPGSGAAVFGTSPSIATGTFTGLSTFQINGANYKQIVNIVNTNASGIPYLSMGDGTNSMNWGHVNSGAGNYGFFSYSGLDPAVTAFQYYSTGKVKIIGAGLVLGAPTGDDKGAGTLNFSGTLWTNGTQGIASQTCTVNTASALTLIFTNGILTGGTCNS